MKASGRDLFEAFSQHTNQTAEDNHNRLTEQQKKYIKISVDEI